jgi:restriction system protein
MFATRGIEKLAIQAKMYGDARPVNRRQVFELFGAAAYFECSGAVIATDGRLDPDALKAARALAIAIWRPTPNTHPLDERSTPSQPNLEPKDPAGLQRPFERIWSESIVPLVGRSLAFDNGGQMRVLAVDWGGIDRMSSAGHKSTIPIEPFMWAVRRLNERGSVSRQEINEQFEGRYSSGVTRVLGEVPEFEMTHAPIALRLR